MNPPTSFSSRLAKFFLFLMAALCAVTGAWTILKYTAYRNEQDRIESDRKDLASIEKMAPVLRGYVEAGFTAEERKKEQSRGDWFTFFDNIAAVSGLRSDQYVLPSERKIRGRKFEETRFDIKLTRVDRRSMVRFLWEVEKRRKFIKTAEIKVLKPRKISEFEDLWDGKVVVAFREKPASTK
jgi:hypothetical protein